MDTAIVERELSEWYLGLFSVIQSTPKFSPLKEFLNISPGQPMNSWAWRECFDRMLDAAFLNDKVYDLSIDAIDTLTRQILKIPSAATKQDTQTLSLVQNLFTKGHCSLPALSPEKTQQMREYFESQPVLTGDRKNLVPLDRNNLQENIAAFSTRSIVESPHLLEYATDPQILSVVETYFGATPTAIAATAWWSFANREAPKDAQLFHWDYGDFRFLNLFLYLTDVDMESGPTVLIEEAHTLHHLRKLANETCSQDFSKFMDWYCQGLRKSDEDVARFTGRSPKYFTGNAGTAFLADTRGLHKGLLPKSNDRLLCQITYGVSPRYQSPIDRSRFRGHPKNLAQSPANYIFRLLVNTIDRSAFQVEQLSSQIFLHSYRLSKNF